MMLFGDSGDGYSDLAMKYDSLGASGQAISVGTGRYGTNSLRFSGGNGRVVKGVVPGSATAGGFLSLPLRYVPTISERVVFANLWDAILERGHVAFCRNVDGSISAYQQTSNNAPFVISAGATLLDTTPPGLWRAAIFGSVEVYASVHASAGYVRIRVNGNEVLTLGPIPTKNPTGSATWSCWHAGSSGYGVMDFDNLLIYDDFDNGDGITDFIGDKDAECRRVTGAGASSGYTRNSGATNASCVDDVTPDGDASYVASDTLTEKDTYAHEPLVRITDGIVLAQLAICAKKPAAGTRAIQGVVRSGGVDYPSGVDLYLGTDYAIYTDPRPLDPDTGLAWVAADVDSSEIGQVTTL